MVGPDAVASVSSWLCQNCLTCTDLPALYILYSNFFFAWFKPLSYYACFSQQCHLQLGVSKVPLFLKSASSIKKPYQDFNLTDLLPWNICSHMSFLLHYLRHIYIDRNILLVYFMNRKSFVLSHCVNKPNSLFIQTFEYWLT